MILQEKIRKKAEGYGKLSPVFLEGAEFALNNQFISVEDDLPCNHEELIDGNITHPLLVRNKNGIYYVTAMAKFEEWTFMSNDITHWLPIPKLPEDDKTMERKIGETFEYNGVRLICLQNDNNIKICDNCYFRDNVVQCWSQMCAYKEREDGNNVYFKEIKE